MMPAEPGCEAPVRSVFRIPAPATLDALVAGAAAPDQRAVIARHTGDGLTVAVVEGGGVVATVYATAGESGWWVDSQAACDGLDPVDGVFAEVGDVSAGVRLTLWHCGVDPVLFDDQEWEVPRRYLPFDATNAPGDFDGRGTLTLVAPGRAVFTDDTGRELTFAPSSQLSEPPGCA